MELVIHFILENWLNWLPMVLAGLVMSKSKSRWRWLWALLLALVPLLALPGTWMINQLRAVHGGMFMTIGLFAGCLLGLLLRRKEQAAT
jgi:hypothetical protein